MKNYSINEITESVLGRQASYDISEVLESCDLETNQIYHNLPAEYQEMTDNFLLGNSIFPINSNSFFRYMFMENTDRHCLEDFISAILNMPVTIKGTWESEPCIKERGSMICLDLVIETPNRQYADVELIKTGRNLSPRHLECIEADMIIRQYQRVKKIKQHFKFEHLRPMYLIILADKNNNMFANTSGEYARSKTSKFSTGETQNCLVKLHHIALDSFVNSKKNRNTYLDGWLTLLTTRSISEIFRLINIFPMLNRFYSRYTALRDNPEKLIRYVDRMLSDYEKDQNRIFRTDILSEKDAWTKKFCMMQNTLEKKEQEINSLRRQLETAR